MTQVRVARWVALYIAVALVASPVVAVAEEGDVTPVSQAPLVPTAVPTTPAPTPPPVIVVRSYATAPQRVLVGSAFDLTIVVYNATGRRADNAVVSLGAAAAIGAAAGATPAGGLTVLGSGNAKYLGTLKGQREAAVSFQVMAGPGTPAGALAVPVTISFEHEGTRQNVEYSIGLLVERDAALSLVTAELPETVMQGETFDASFEVGNASGFALAGVTLSVEASGAVVTDGSLFLGSMEAAATEGLDVTITPERSGPLEVAMVVTYRDDFGRMQTFRESRTVQVEAVPEQTSAGPDDAMPEDDGESQNWFVRFVKSLFGLGS